MNNDEFYRECARLLNTDYDCQSFPWYKRTRWNNRKAGSGRYQGHGIIRHFGSCIHVALNGVIKLSGVYSSEQDVLDAIKRASE